jgi:lipopolysaccharide biosynthesis protein
VRPLAFYLPQYYPTPENDEFWGPGFTEWTNVARARPLFRGHIQPKLPGELGFYDLRTPDTREAQAELARDHGIEGFVYWHYWFAGRRVLDRPFREVLEGGRPDFPFALAWANQTWTGIWHGAEDRILIEQTYPGRSDYKAHFAALAPALMDPRYVRVDGKPLLVIFRPAELPDARELSDTWRTEAERRGLPGLHLVGIDIAENWDPRPAEFDGVIFMRLPRMYELTNRYPLVRARWVLNRSTVGRSLDPFRRRPLALFQYEDAVPLLIPESRPAYESYPCVVTNWDNTPRSGSHGSVLQNATPEAFQTHARAAFRYVSDLAPEHQLVFLKSWNEWAEGNYLEPDRIWGTAFLKTFRDTLAKHDPPAGVRGALQQAAGGCAQP